RRRQLQRAHELEAEQRAIECRVVLLRELALLRDRGLQVALLVTGLALCVGLRALLGPARERERRRQELRRHERLVAVEIGARRALLLGDELLEPVDRALVALAAGL